MVPSKRRTLYKRGGKPQLDSEERAQVRRFLAWSRLAQPEALGPTLQENERGFPIMAQYP